MRYSPASGDQVALALAGAYQPPAGDNVALELGLPCYARPRGDEVALALAGKYEPPAGDSVALDILCDVFKLPCYTIPAGDAVTLEIAGTYTPPQGDAVALPLVCDVPLPPPPEPEPEPEPDPGYIFGGLTTSARIAWAPRPKSSLRALTSATWRQSGKRDAAPRVAWGEAVPWHVNMRVSWAKVPQRDKASRAAWEGLNEVKLRHGTRAAWQFTPPKDGQSRVSWGTSPAPVAVCAGVAHSNPPAKDWQARVSWDAQGENLRAEVGAVWLDSLAKDSLDYRIPWGYLDGTRYVFLEPEPAPPPPPPVDEPCYLPPDGDQVALGMGGLYLRPSGDQIALNLTCLTRTLFARRSFIMSHTLSVVRLPNREPINCTGLTIETDEESWAWAFSLSIGDRASYHLLQPTATENQEIEITLDGYVWTAFVEDPAEQRTPGQLTRFSARGRSRTALLAAPFAAARSYTNDSAMSAAQLADRELEFTGFSLDWQGPTWTVPAGAWSYTSLTPMGAITRIAEAAGCYVLSDMADKIVHVLPRYPTPPWDYGQATPDVLLQSGAAASLATRRLPGPKYHGVYISGETQGVLTEIKRDGTSGAPYAEMIVDPLSTDTAPNIQRGIGVIADAQDRKEQPLSLPFGVGVGPIKPAELVEVQDTVFGTYRARGTALRITCELRDDALSVRQQVTLHQYHDDVGA